MAIPRTFLIAVMWVLSFHILAQGPGLRRPSVKYQQIRTDTVRVIFPDGMEDTGQRVARLCTEMARMRPMETGAPLRRIDILLQNATDIPNGYVGLGPWRSELYLTPPQSSFELGSLAWYDLLAIHEFRHVQQLSAARTGISKLIFYAFGGEAYSGAVHVAMPDWYIEGDAVMAETALTPQGRGRLPAFLNGYRERVRDGSYWSYAKARNGSLREYVPSHYELGYLLVNYGRERFGQQTWDSIAIDAAAYKGLFYPFSRALKQRTGLGTVQFYQQAMNGYHARWAGIVKEDRMHTPMLDEETRYRNLSYPVFDAAGRLYVMVERFDKIPAICAVTLQGLQHVVTPGFQTEPVFHVSGGKVCWTELRRHPRWFREDFSVIVVHDLNKGSRKTITQTSSYFMPALSADGEKVVAVHDDDFHQYALHVLSARDGEVLARLPNPGNLFYTHPQWTEDGMQIISAARHQDGTMSLIGQFVHDGVVVEYVSPGYTPIGRPYLSGEWIYFAMTSGQVDEIFRVHRSTKYFQQVTSDGLSKYQPAVDPVDGELVFTQFSLRGKQLMRLDPGQAEMPLARRSAINLDEPVLMQGEGDLTRTLPETIFPSKRYGLLTRPVRLHSLGWYADDPEYGLEVLSENTLNTIQWRNGWHYNQNTGYHGPYSQLSIGLWYPELVAAYRGTRINVTRQNEEFVWWQHVKNVGVRIPFYGYSGPYMQSGAFTTRFNHVSTAGDVDISFHYLSHIVHFRNARRVALQHAESRFSQSVVLRVLHATDTTNAGQFHISTDFTVPSPLRNHFFSLSFDYKHELAANSLRFGDVFRYAWGYDPLRADDLSWFGVSYQLPLVYPDVGFAGIAYLRRVRVNPFFHVMRGDGITYRSAGSEVFFDLHLLNVEPVTVGLRWAKQLDLDKRSVFALTLPVGF